MYFDLVVIGNLTLDRIVTPLTEINTFGGTAAYTSITAKRLGSSVGIVSKIGSDFPRAYLNQLRKEDVDLYCVQVSNATTQFELVYDHNWNRRLKLKAQCAKILSEDIPKKFFDTKIIHFGPVFREIDYKIVSFVKDNFTGEISLGLQGLVRAIKNDTIEISHPSDLDRILETIDILFANETEIIIDPSKELNQNIEIFKKLGPKIIIITLGKKGSIIFSGDDSFHIPPVKAETRDPTGAGDSFVGGFIGEYLKTKDIKRAGLVGSAAASFVIEDYGPFNFPKNPDEILKRLISQNIAF